MQMDVEEIANQAMHLPAEDRVVLAERLWASVDAPEEAAIARAWADEAERRADEIDSGKVRMLAADEVFSRIEQKLRARGK